LVGRLWQRQDLARDAFGIALLPNGSISPMWGSVIGTYKTLGDQRIGRPELSRYRPMCVFVIEVN